jgi:hypothetical protein
MRRLQEEPFVVENEELARKVDKELEELNTRLQSLSAEC